MKLHIVAASDILSKGLDPSFPHSQLGEDGLLVVPSQIKTSEALSIPEPQKEVLEPVDVAISVQTQSPVDVPEQEETNTKPLDIPVEEEKKHGKSFKVKKSQGL